MTGTRCFFWLSDECFGFGQIAGTCALIGDGGPKGGWLVRTDFGECIPITTSEVFSFDPGVDMSRVMAGGVA